MITCYVDGGNLGNGTPDNHAYGSAVIIQDGEVKKSLQWDWGQELATNNEAEHASMTALLIYLVELAGRCNAQQLRLMSPVTIKCDSALVLNHLRNTWKHKTKFDEWVKESQEAIQLLKQKLDVELVHVDDTEVKQVLGH